MQATIDWSYDLLDPAERWLFRRLAVFSGGFTLDAAEAVAGDDAPLDVLDGVTSLVDQSLLRTIDHARDGLPRFGMLETVREYGLGQLRQSGEETESRDRHAAWAVDLAERAEPELTEANQQHWFSRLATEHDNLRAALGWTIEQHDAQTAQRIASSIYRFWVTEDHFTEGRDWLEAALALDPGKSTSPRGWSLIGAGVLAFFLGDYQRATECHIEARGIFTAIGDARGVASCYGNLGLIADAEMDYDLAIERYSEALERFRALNDVTHIRFMLGNLGLIRYFQGRYDDASALMEESLAIAREMGDRHSQAISLGNLGMVAYALGDYDRAAAIQRDVLLLRRELPNQSHLATTLDKVAMIAAVTGAPTRAARLFGAADALRAEVGGLVLPNDREILDRAITRARAETGEIAFTTAWDAGARLSADAALNYALGETWDDVSASYRTEDARAE
jgi:non-specific serine/threonine protein kinase